MMRLADMLRIYISAHGLLQKNVAKEIGINESTLSRFLSGENIPDGISMMKILAWVSGESITKTGFMERLDNLENVVSQIRNVNHLIGR